MENIPYHEAPTEQEILRAAEILAKLRPGFLPFKIFHEVARLTTTPIVEFVPFRRNGDTTEILLLRRPADDPVWPNQLHTPGTVVRATDTLETCMSRIIEKELSGVQVSEPVLAGNVLHDSGRGNEAAQVYWIQITGEIEGAEFYDIEALPEQLVQSQLDFIPLAVQSYRSNR